MERLTGVVWRITYRSEENGYTVIKLKTNYGANNLLKIIGYFPEIHVGMYLTVFGKWKYDNKFGHQFQILDYEIKLPADVLGIEKYLSGGIIKGLGPKQAKKIVSHFKENTFDVLDSRPERLKEIGIGEKIIDSVTRVWKQQKEIKNILDFLKEMKINTMYALPIYKKFGNQSIEKIKENPYLLMDTIKGIGFETSDCIARQIGIEKNSYIRCRAGVLYSLNKLANSGHCFGTVDQIAETGHQLLGIERENLVMTIGEMRHTGDVITEENYSAVYLPAFYYSEIGIANHIKRIMDKPRNKKIGNVELDTGIRYDSIQKNSIKLASQNKMLIITGGPGTGKTTTIKGILNMFQNNGFKILLTAPTGRAVKRMEEATGMEAKTIHRLLGYSKNGGYIRNENNTFKEDAIIIDEASMIDIVLMNNLLKAIPNHMSVIIVGDVNQLPSIGPGNILQDLIDSHILPVVELKNVYRQSNKSNIIRAAHLVNNGIAPSFKNDKNNDLFFIKEKDADNILKIIGKLVMTRLPSFYKVDPLKDIFVLSPILKTEIGVDNINKELQVLLNKSEIFIEFMGTKFKVNDRVMQTQNNYDKDVYNGDIGIISFIDLKAGEVIVNYDKRKVRYKFAELSELTLAYALTIHKSQGSEFQIVILPIHSLYSRMLQRNLIYTAITRAKKVLVIIGEDTIIQKAVKNNMIEHRNTKLKDRLINRLSV